MDASALVAIVRLEAGADWLIEQLEAAADRVMAAPTFVEFAMVLESRVPASVGLARRAIRDAAIEIVPFDDDLADRSMEGWRRFGKDRHPAGLNFEDCRTYALVDKYRRQVLPERNQVP